ncbi:MAG: hypothetical protein LBI13_09465 [Streptococcaceae bacterium]|jgi:Rgg/GadR/MutR family transcriptional activator|nr:hypothetical protein [Streptococcaceae bacterium]
MNNKQIGETFKKLRRSKGISQIDIVSHDFSQSALSRFEKGENSISVVKFLTILENSGIMQDEFYQHLQLNIHSKNPLFTPDLVIAYNLNDSKLMLDIIREQEIHFRNTRNPIDRLALVYSKTIYEFLTKNKILTSIDTNYAFEYLMSLKGWSRVEIRLASAFLNIFNDEQLTALLKVINKKTRKFLDDMLTKQKYYQLLGNLLDCLLMRKRYKDALTIVNSINFDHIPDDMTMEKIYFNFNQQHTLFCNGNSKALDKMKAIRKSCEILGLDTVLRPLDIEIDRCETILNKGKFYPY